MPPLAAMAPLLSFFDGRIYRAASNSWGGWAILYSLSVTTLSWVILLPVSLPPIASSFEEFVEKFDSSFPDFTVSDGAFHSDVPQPFAISDQQGKVMLIIDESVEGDAAPQWSGDPIFFIGKSSLFYGGGGRMSRISMTEVPTMNKAHIVGALRSMPGQMWVIALILSPLLIFGSLCLRLGLTLLWSLFAVGVGKAGGRAFHFSGAFRVVAVASTPALFISTAGSAGGWGAWASWAGLGATLFYITFGMLALDKRK